jgi:Ca-activated chloride channel family protein
MHLGFALLVLAVARPQWGRIEEPVFDQAREIVIALDLSRSMLATDIRPSRLDRAKLLVTSLLERLAGERVGLIVFSGTAFLQSPLSSDYEILNEFLPNLSPDYLPQGGSNYKALIENALTAFSASGSADRFLIVLSDGEATEDSWRAAAQELKEKGIRVLGLGIGTAQGSILPDPAGGYIKDERGAVVLSKLEPATLQELANTTGGVYVDASSWVDLAQLLQSTVEKGHKGEFREERRARYAERFQWALAPALLLFLWSLLSEFPVHPRPRDVKLQPRRGSQAPAERIAKTTATAAGLALAVLIFSVSPRIHAAETSAAEPLSKLVAEFAGRPNLSARDYAELANSTLTYGQRMQGAQQPPVEGAIRDGLAAIDAGEALDAKAADWPDLRRKLEDFLKKPEPPPQDQQKQDQQKKDQQDKKQQQQQQKDQNSGGKSDSDQKQEKQDQPQKEPEKENEQKDQSKDGSGESPQQKDAKSTPPADPKSAFGDMQKNESEQSKAQPPPPSPSSSETQKVGGTQEKKSETPADPSLVVPLQRLQQVKNQDSPIRLQQLMRSDKETPASQGKNW